MKIKTTLCLLALALGATTTTFAAPITSVIVSSNSISIPVNSIYPKKNKIMFGGKAAIWHQLGSTNIIVDLPPNLPGGTYLLYLLDRPTIAVSIGTTGPVGPAGAQGPQGEQGSQGLQGIPGSQGLQGLQGLQGEQGLQGLPGLNGANGLDGVNGTNGLDGVNGTNGLNGLDGINGLNGTDGLNGTNGLNGLNGTNGLDGINGTNGVNGLNGTNGLNGVNGTNGLNGQNGSLTVNSFIYAFDTGLATVPNNGLITLSSYGANTSGGDSWSTNGSTFTIPTNGVYQIQFHISGAQSTHSFVVNLTNSPSSFVADGVNQGYFIFDASGNKATAVLQGQIIANCAAGDVISLVNASGFSFTYGNSVPTNAPSATLSILQIH